MTSWPTAGQLPATGGCFTPMAMRPAGQFAIGYAQRVEPSQGDGDDTGLNSVRLTCSNYARSERQIATSAEGHFGSWFPEGPATAAT